MDVIDHQNSNEPKDAGGTTGQRVKAYRRQRGLTAQAMADRMGISVSGYNKLEGGARGWGEDKIRGAAEALGVPAEALLSQDDTPYTAPPSLGSLGLFVEQAKEDAAALLMAKLGISRDKIHIEIRL